MTLSNKYSHHELHYITECLNIDGAYEHETSFVHQFEDKWSFIVDTEGGT